MYQDQWIKKFQNLLNSNPEEKLILPSKYNLYKIYELLGESDEAIIAKNDIISKYPDSRYAELLLNPRLELSKDENNTIIAIGRSLENLKRLHTIAKQLNPAAQILPVQFDI